MDLIPFDSGLPFVDVRQLEEEVAAAAAFAEAEKSLSTRRAYLSDMRIFTVWCRARGLSSLPASASTAAVFLSSQAKEGAKVSTISRRLAAIRDAHKRAGEEPPTNTESVKATMRGIRRSLGAAPDKKAPATAEIVRRMIAGITGERPIDVRDRALLLLGFALAMRRSELVTLRVEDLTEEEGKGLRIRIRKSKTDQEGTGQEIAVPYGTGRTCPVRAVRAWLDIAGLGTGVIFLGMRKGGGLLPPVWDELMGQERGMSGQSLAEMLKRRAEAIGLDPTVFAGHSLRSGFLTSAARNGASIWKLADQSRHRSLDTLRGYVRAVELFDDHAGAGLL
jgi:integrase